MKRRRSLRPRSTGSPLPPSGFGLRGSNPRRKPLKKSASRRDPRPAIDHLPEDDHCFPGGILGGPCSGQVDPCHIGIDQQTLRDWWDKQKLRREWGVSYNAATLEHEREEFVWLPCWIRKGCRSHHQAFDGRGKSVLDREHLPLSVEEGAERYGLAHRLTRDFGARRSIVERFAA